MTLVPQPIDSADDARQAPALSQRLRAETAESHRLAERSGVMTDLLRGRMERAEYIHLLRALYVVYEAMERRLAALATHDVVRPFRIPALDRAPALARDLDVLHGRGWRHDLLPSRASLDYASQIEAAPAALLVAHAYVRYLGDLSGGQALGRIVARALALTDGEGVAFYSFPGIPDIDAFKGRFRAALDAMQLAPSEADAVVAEALRAFALNVRVFEELSTRTPSSAAPPPSHGS